MRSRRVGEACNEYLAFDSASRCASDAVSNQIWHVLLVLHRRPYDVILDRLDQPSSKAAVSRRRIRIFLDESAVHA